MLLKEAKALDYQIFRIFQMPLMGWLFIPGVTLRSPLAISLSFASAFVLSERAAVTLSGALKPPSIPPKGGRTILRMVVMGLVIISISEADLAGGRRTPHRSLRSLCVVLTINQRLRRCAAVAPSVR